MPSSELVWRLQRAAGDLWNWWQGRANPVGRQIGLQPWPLMDGLPLGTRVEIVEPMLPARPGPLVDYYDDHAERGAGDQVTLLAGQRRSYSFADIIALRGHVFMDPRSGKVVRLPFYRSLDYSHPGIDVVGDYAALRAPVLRSRARKIDGPVFVADPRHTGYGHLLLEVVPRLGHLGSLPKETKVFTGVPASKARHALFGALGVPPDRVIQSRAPALCREAYAVDNPLDLTGHIGPAARETYGRLSSLAKTSTIATPERLFVSRRDVDRRKLRNEAEIEVLFARYGFEIVQPEKLPLSDQIRLFANANFIAGARGSGMHNIVFARPETRMLLLTHRGFIQPVDAILMQQDHALAIAVGEPDPTGGLAAHITWTIDAGLVERAIKAHFGL